MISYANYLVYIFINFMERDGVVVDRRTLNQKVMGSIPRLPQASPCCGLEQDTLAPYGTG